MRRSRSRSMRRQGAIAVLAAVMLVVLLALVAFALDVGYIALVRTEAQAAADSAALAGGQELLSELRVRGDHDAAWSHARRVADEYASWNRVGPHEALLKTDEDVLVVRATVDRGRQTRLFLPFTLKIDDWDALLRNEGEDNWCYNEQHQTVTRGRDGVRELTMFPISSGAGNLGTVRIGVNNNGTSTLRRQIRNGISAEDLQQYNGASELDAATGTLTLGGNRGVSAGRGSLGAAKPLRDPAGAPRAVTGRLPLRPNGSADVNNYRSQGMSERFSFPIKNAVASIAPTTNNEKRRRSDAERGAACFCGSSHQRVAAVRVRARAAWLAARQAELLPVSYFHVVFTLPPEIARLAFGNRRVLYDLLFQCASETLLEVAADPKHLGARIGVLAVLHTWGQNLDHHPHVHCVVPGGGLSEDESRWVACRKNFFLPVKVLSRKFRGKFLAHLKAAHAAGKLKFAGSLASLAHPAAFGRLLSQAYAREWVVYSKPPFGGPQQTLKYLARYTHRVAISNARLLDVSDSG